MTKYILPATVPGISPPKRLDTLSLKGPRNPHDGFSSLGGPLGELAPIAKPSGATAQRK
jgi:hypothetical protein